MKYLPIIATQIMTLAAIAMFDLGIRWIDSNTGFHPIAAGAVAILLMLAPYLIANSEGNNYDETNQRS